MTNLSLPLGATPLQCVVSEVQPVTATVCVVDQRYSSMLQRSLSALHHTDCTDQSIQFIAILSVVWSTNLNAYVNGATVFSAQHLFAGKACPQTTVLLDSTLLQLSSVGSKVQLG